MIGKLVRIRKTSRFCDQQMYMGVGKIVEICESLSLPYRVQSLKNNYINGYSLYDLEFILEDDDVRNLLGFTREE